MPFAPLVNKSENIPLLDQKTLFIQITHPLIQFLKIKRFGYRLVQVKKHAF